MRSLKLDNFLDHKTSKSQLNIAKAEAYKKGLETGFSTAKESTQSLVKNVIADISESISNIERAYLEKLEEMEEAFTSLAQKLVDDIIDHEAANLVKTSLSREISALRNERKPQNATLFLPDSLIELIPQGWSETHNPNLNIAPSSAAKVNVPGADVEIDLDGYKSSIRKTFLKALKDSKGDLDDKRP